MQVELFETLEMNTDLILDDAEESKTLCEKLNLKGQHHFYKSNKIFPYRKMTQEEKLIYATICPVITKVKDYSEGIIPLRILKTIEEINDFEWCKLEIWHPKSADEIKNDPILVGRRETQEKNELFLIGRWGEILLPFEELKEKAKKLIKKPNIRALFIIWAVSFFLLQLFYKAVLLVTSSSTPLLYPNFVEFIFFLLIPFLFLIPFIGEYIDERKKIWILTKKSY